MKIPTIRGVIDRRILVNYRVSPEVLAARLPAPFRPQCYNGHAVAGICLIRLAGVRPRVAPAALGLASENAAHRAAVAWDDQEGRHREGVYIWRRETSSRLNALAGGRIFPGVHSHARFDVAETETHFDVAVSNADGTPLLAVAADLSEDLPAGSMFETLEAASAFFEGGSIGYSPTTDRRRFQGLTLQCRNWRVEPLTISSARSAFFDDPALFPPGSIEPDCALLMRGIEHEWHGRPDLCCATMADA